MNPAPSLPQPALQKFLEAKAFIPTTLPPIVALENAAKTDLSRQKELENEKKGFQEKARAHLSLLRGIVAGNHLLARFSEFFLSHPAPNPSLEQLKTEILATPTLEEIRDLFKDRGFEAYANEIEAYLQRKAPFEKIPEEDPLVSTWVLDLALKREMTELQEEYPLRRATDPDAAGAIYASLSLAIQEVRPSEKPEEAQQALISILKKSPLANRLSLADGLELYFSGELDWRDLPEFLGIRWTACNLVPPPEISQMAATALKFQSENEKLVSDVKTLRRRNEILDQDRKKAAGYLQNARKENAALKQTLEEQKRQSDGRLQELQAETAQAKAEKEAADQAAKTAQEAADTARGELAASQAATTRLSGENTRIQGDLLVAQQTLEEQRRQSNEIYDQNFQAAMQRFLELQTETAKANAEKEAADQAASAAQEAADTARGELAVSQKEIEKLKIELKRALPTGMPLQAPQSDDSSIVPPPKQVVASRRQRLQDGDAGIDDFTGETSSGEKRRPFGASSSGSAEAAPAAGDSDHDVTDPGYRAARAAQTGSTSETEIDVPIDVDEDALTPPPVSPLEIASGQPGPTSPTPEEITARNFLSVVERSDGASILQTLNKGEKDTLISTLDQIQRNEETPPEEKRLIKTAIRKILAYAND